MKKIGKFNSFLVIVLTLFLVAGNTSLPALAFEKKSFNAGQVKTETATKNFKNLANFSIGLANIKEKTSLERSEQIEANEKDYVDGEILVKYRDSKIDLETPAGLAASLNFAEIKYLDKKEDLKKSNISVLKIKDSKTVEQKIAELETDPNVEYVEPNYLRYISAIDSNDPFRSKMWALENTRQAVNGTSGTDDKDIDGKEAWSLSTGAGSIVAVIDTGVAYNHPDLAGSMWNGDNCLSEAGSSLGGCQHGYDFTDKDTIPLPTDESHGTHVAGIIAAALNNNIGIIGVAPLAKIMALRVERSGRPGVISTDAEIRAIDFAIENGAKIINASFGGHSFSDSEFNAINRFKNAGGIFVAAAGNESVNNDSSHTYPSDYDLDNIISVAATDQNDVLADFSNYSATSVDVGAPGTNILSTAVNFTDGFHETYAYADGTSMATPHVAGLAALIEGYKPDLTVAEVKNAILTTGDSVESLSGQTVSGKRINAFNALRSLAPATHTISGTVRYYDGIKVILNATVTLENNVGTQIAVTATDANGFYQFSEVASGGNYVVRVSKSDNASGLTGNDQNKIGRHIVGLEPFNTLYKIIAGDVNNSGTLTGNDQNRIGRFIVGLDNTLPSGAWKFYSPSATLNPTNYLTSGLTRSYADLTANAPNQDFVGIKMGDVNNSWVSN